MAEERDPDLDIAIGEDAFRAGWEAAIENLTGQCPDPSAWAIAWAAYTPPEELCGGGTDDG